MRDDENGDDSGLVVGTGENFPALVEEGLRLVKGVRRELELKD